jgi:hypothetical protein
MYKKLALLILSLGAVAGAQAMSLVPPGSRPNPGNGNPTVTGAPEIDPASAMSAFTLLAGGLVLIRGRRAGK